MKRRVAYHTFFLVLIIIALVMTIIGAILIWAAIGRQKDAHLANAMNGFWSAYPLAVPAISLIAHFKRSRPTYILAAAICFVVVLQLSVPANNERIAISGFGNYDVGKLNLHFAGLILQMTGACLAILPAAFFWHPTVAGIVFNCILAVSWLATGVLSCFGEDRDPIPVSVSVAYFLFFAWTLLTGFTRSKTSTVALTAAQILVLPTLVFYLVALASQGLRTVALIMACCNIGIYLIWTISDFACHRVSDRVKHQKFKDEYTLN